MGSWKLEVFRKSTESICYRTMLCSSSLSRPELFKDRVIEARKRHHPPPNPERDELVSQLKERERLRRETEVLEQMSHYQTINFCLIINYLEKRADIDRVHVKDKKTCTSDAFVQWEEKTSCELPGDMKRFYTISDGLEIRWSFKTENTKLQTTFIGKMYINSLNDLNKIVLSGSKQMAVDELNDFAENNSPRFNSQSWHIFELDPCDGQGRVCLVYNPHHEVSIWFLDRSLHFHKIAATFTDYYRLLLLHCGLPYWQYKYTDIGIPPYVLHWYYTITPSLLISPVNEDISLTTVVPFNAEKAFQANAHSATKNSKTISQQNSTGQNQSSGSDVAGVRSATQNPKRPVQQMKSINRSSSIPRSLNN
ncbi:unnamed protein product [Adineta ricciae]|uniref:Knr4/Smi1-like domain-containing protein n=1 Tax=Adineta ricciae TaxID=249248 RepID=A0A814MA86_ADIRI|nr:unnamed protein product [Adineta ricciae]